MARKDLQDRDELFIINSFLQFLAAESGVLCAIDKRPDPPDAIIRAGEHTTWLEITTAYYSSQWAQDIYSYCNPDEDHVPMESPRTESGKRIGFCNMTKQFVNNFEKIVLKKLRKETYQQFTESYGRGTLLVGIEFPWFSCDTIDDMRKVWDARDPSRVRERSMKYTFTTAIWVD